MEDYNNLLELEKKIKREIGKLKEYELYILLKKTVLKDLTLVKDNEYSRHDCLIKDGAVELKCRRSHYQTLRIQKDKYEHMLQFNKKYYICSTNCGIYFFNLDKINPVWEQTMNPKCSEFNDNRLILKWTYDIPLKDGINIVSLINKKIIKK